MHILFTRFPLESTLGGAEIQTLSLMEGLRDAGHTVSFLGSCPTLLSECKKRNIPTTELHIGEPPVTKIGSLTFLWRKRKMRSLLEQAIEKIGHIDAIVMLSLSEKLLLTWKADALGVQVLWIEHDRIGRWLTWNPWLPALRRLAELARTVCVSELSRKMYLNLGWPKNRTILIPNGIDLQKFQNANSQPVARKTKLVIGSVARLSPEKGVDVLIDAVCGSPDIRLMIVGKGKQEAALRRMIRKHESGYRIEILPEMDDIAGFYRSLDVFVLPSREHDPYGLAAGEAMASGVATIVTDTCGIAGELTDGTDALVVKADDAGAMREAISSLLQETKRKSIAKAGIVTAKRRFGLEAMIEKYLGLIS